MLIIVTGGSRSGKSGIAERIAERLCPGNKIYLATMVSSDAECEERIGLHRKRREGKGYQTVECGRHLERLEISEGNTVLLEDLSNLAANELYHSDGSGEEASKNMIEGILRIDKKSRHLIVVANEVFSDIVRYEESRHYLEVIGEVQQQIVKEADVFIEAVYGIPVFYKGKEKLEEM